MLDMGRSSVPQRVVRDRRAPARRTRGPATLAIDIGGSGLKASVLDPKGKMMVARVRIATPDDLDARTLVKLLVSLTKDLPSFDRVSVGFPGVVRKGVIRTAPNLGTERLGG